MNNGDDATGINARIIFFHYSRNFDFFRNCQKKWTKFDCKTWKRNSKKSPSTNVFFFFFLEWPQSSLVRMWLCSGYEYFKADVVGAGFQTYSRMWERQPWECCFRQPESLVLRTIDSCGNREKRKVLSFLCFFQASLTDGQYRETWR